MRALVLNSKGMAIVDVQETKECNKFEISNGYKLELPQWLDLTMLLKDIKSRYPHGILNGIDEKGEVTMSRVYGLSKQEDRNLRDASELFSQEDYEEIVNLTGGFFGTQEYRINFKLNKDIQYRNQYA